MLEKVLSIVPAAEFRLVGTASSLLRGIDLAVGDIDILFRHRSGVDEWFEVLYPDAIVEISPEWLPASGQYFAELLVDGVKVELSTVEWVSDDDTIECYGRGPWLHFDELDVDGVPVPAVASELRLVSEFVRGRPERFGPIVEFLRKHGCDLDLVRRGLASRGATDDEITRVVEGLDPDRPS